MPDQPNDPQQKVTLEDLLRVKRSERPDQAFWGQFDRELHQRMMQTLVKKDAWYVQLARGFKSRLAQTATVGGLTALLLITFGRSLMMNPTLSTEMASDNVTVSESATLVADVQTVASISQLEAEPIASDALVDLTTSSHDYKMVAINGPERIADKGYKRDFALESLQVARSERADYSGDVAMSSLSFVNTGVASLVY